jgi:hypothetical protein
MGYTLVLPNVSDPENPSDLDRQVRCISYLSKHLSDFVHIPPWLKSEVLPIRYPPGSEYPGIGLYVPEGVDHNVDQIPDPDIVEARLNAFLTEIGMKRLLVLAEDETLNWESVRK